MSVDEIHKIYQRELQQIAEYTIVQSGDTNSRDDSGFSETANEAKNDLRLVHPKQKTPRQSYYRSISQKLFAVYARTF